MRRMNREPGPTGPPVPLAWMRRLEQRADGEVELVRRFPGSPGQLDAVFETEHAQGRDQPYAGADATTITASDDDGYELRSLADPSTPPLAWLVRKAGGVWGEGLEYTVTYNRGYVAGVEPGAIRRLIIALTKLEWERWKREGGLLRSATYDRVSYQLADVGNGLPEWTRDTISAWRVPVW